MIMVTINKRSAQTAITRPKISMKKETEVFFVLVDSDLLMPVMIAV